jgi:hypothetical protein
MEGMYQQLFHEGNRDVYIMSITFGKRGANISNRHIEKYQELMADWSRDGVFAEGITMTERGAESIPSNGMLACFHFFTDTCMQGTTILGSTCKACMPHS